MNNLTIRMMRRGEEMEVVQLITRVFQSRVAPQYTEEGIEEFMRYLGTVMLLQGPQSGRFMMVATQMARIIGVIEMRNYNHVSMLFVDEPYQRQGVGRTLLERALHRSRQREPQVVEVSVNSSPNAVLFYERQGFRATAEEQEKRGIRFVPMVMRIEVDR